MPLPNDQQKSAQPYNGYQNYGPNYVYQNNPPIKSKLDIFDPKGLKKAKKLDIFDKLFTKILDTVVDKAGIAIPKLFTALFGINSGDYGNDMESIKSFGLMGFAPMIILKVISHITYYINQLQKNKFLKTFLVPALIIGLVAGLIVFLIWWMQPDENNDGYSNNYGTNYPNYGQPPYTTNYRNNPEELNNLIDYKNNFPMDLTNYGLNAINSNSPTNHIAPNQQNSITKFDNSQYPRLGPTYSSKTNLI